MEYSEHVGLDGVEQFFCLVWHLVVESGLLGDFLIPMFDYMLSISLDWDSGFTRLCRTRMSPTKALHYASRDMFT